MRLGSSKAVRLSRRSSSLVGSSRIWVIPDDRRMRVARLPLPLDGCLGSNSRTLRKAATVPVPIPRSNCRYRPLMLAAPLFRFSSTALLERWRSRALPAFRLTGSLMAGRRSTRAT